LWVRFKKKRYFKNFRVFYIGIVMRVTFETQKKIKFIWLLILSISIKWN